MSRVLPWICLLCSNGHFNRVSSSAGMQIVFEPCASSGTCVQYETISSLACRSLPLKLHSSLFLSGVFHASCTRKTPSNAYSGYHRMRCVIVALDHWELSVLIAIHAYGTSGITLEMHSYKYSLCGVAVYSLTLTFLCSVTALISERLRAKRLSRAPTYSMLSSLLRRREVKLKTPLAEKLLVCLSFASRQKHKHRTEEET